MQHCLVLGWQQWHEQHQGLMCMQDMKDNMFAETEPALALKEIRSRDPNFDMVKFLYNLKVDVPVVIQAYLRGQVDTLREHCSKDMVERLSGIIAAQTAQVCLCQHRLLFPAQTSPGWLSCTVSRQYIPECCCQTAAVQGLCGSYTPKAVSPAAFLPL